MKFTLNISEKLLKEAKAVTETDDINQIVEIALRDLVMRSKRRQLINSKGTLDLDVDLDILRKRSKDG